MAKFDELRHAGAKSRRIVKPTSRAPSAADLRKQLNEALEQQAATSEVLRKAYETMKAYERMSPEEL